MQRLGRTLTETATNPDTRRQATQVLQQASHAALQTAWRVTQSAVWLVTNDTSPVAPFQAQAWQFVRTRWDEAVQHPQNNMLRIPWFPKINAPSTTTTWKLPNLLTTDSKGNDKISSPDKEGFGKELLEQMSQAKDKAAVVLDEEILEIQNMAQQLQQEVNAQIAAAKKQKEATTTTGIVVIKNVIPYFAKTQILETQRQFRLYPTDDNAHVPKPLLDAYQEKRMKRIATESPQAKDQGQLADPGVVERTIVINGLERKFKERQRASTKKRPNPNNDNRNKNKDNEKIPWSPVSKRTDPEIFQRKLLQTRLEMETQQRWQKKQQDETKNVQRDGSLHSKHIFLSELQSGNAEKVKHGKIPIPSGIVPNEKEGDDDNALLDTEEQKQHQLFQLVNASLGLTAPVDLLRDDVEMKKREVESAQMVDQEFQDRKARAEKERAELRHLMMQVQRASMEKMKRAKQAREEGTLPVIVAALGKENTKKEVAQFERPKKVELSATTTGESSSDPTEASFEQLNRQIRQKYEQEKNREEFAMKKHQSTFVVNKLERKRPRRVAQAAVRLFKRSLLKPFGVMAAALVHLYLSCVHGGTAAKNSAVAFSPTPPPLKDGTILHLVPGWKDLLKSA